MILACCNSDRTLDAVDRKGQVAIVGIAVAELTRMVPAPATHSAIVEDGAGVLGAGRNRNHAGDATDRNWQLAVVEAAVAKLTLPIVAPTLHAPGLGDRATVAASGSNRTEAGRNVACEVWDCG